MKLKVINRYRITYVRGVIQEKDLISHADYLNIVIPLNNKIQKLQSTLDENNEKYSIDKIKENKLAENKIKEKLILLFGDNWFTDGSPLYGAYETGILVLPQHQGGESKCKVEKI